MPSSSNSKFTPRYHKNNRKASLILEGFSNVGGTDLYVFTFRIGILGHSIGFDYSFYPTTELKDFNHRLHL